MKGEIPWDVSGVLGVFASLGTRLFSATLLEETFANVDCVVKKPLNVVFAQIWQEQEKHGMTSAVRCMTGPSEVLMH